MAEAVAAAASEAPVGLTGCVADWKRGDQEKV